MGKNTPARKIQYPGDGPIIKSVTSGKFTDPLTLSRHHLRTLVTIFFLFHFAVHLLAPQKGTKDTGTFDSTAGTNVGTFFRSRSIVLPTETVHHYEGNPSMFHTF